MAKEEADSSPSSSVVSALKETNSKISSFSKEVEQHLDSDDFDSAKDDLDFLHVKNTMMLSYLMDLTHLVRLANGKSEFAFTERLSTCPKVTECLSRLNEMRVAFDRTRPMEKRLRYRIDKLLSVSSDTFAVTEDDDDDEAKNGNNDDSDPLVHGPNVDALLNGADDDDDEDDDDLKTARSIVKSVAPKPYVPPRLVATSMEREGLRSEQHPEDKETAEKNDRRIRRNANRMARNSELVETLRSEYTDAPEEDDAHGGAADAGRESGLSKRLKEQERNRRNFEEEQFVRLVVSRKEKKERNRVDAEERSNLNRLADLGNLTRGIVAFEDEDGRTGDEHDAPGRGGRTSYGGNEDGWEGRLHNGKRKRGLERVSGNTGVKRVNSGSRKLKASNSFQRELYGLKEGKKKKKKSKT